MTLNFDSTKVKWEKSGGLAPAIVQDSASLRVLMLGYMNAEALEQTCLTGLVTFFSRSKNRLWQKGETSGHVLRVKNIALDCDADTLLIMAEPAGPVCHTGMRTCWGEDDDAPSLATLADLAATIRARRQDQAEGSYTAKLFAEGITRIAQKVGEEGVEVALAASTGSPQLPEEAADLLYHLLVLLEASDTGLNSVLKILHARAKK